MRCHWVPFGPFRFHLDNKQMPVRYWFFLLASAQYNSSFMKISVPSPVFRWKTLWWKWNFCKVFTLECQQGDEICFGTKKSASLILKKGRRWERINMQAHSRWLHAIRKCVITGEKTWRKKIWKYAIVFASTHLRITTLRKYPIDPKPYLGRWFNIY